MQSIYHNIKTERQYKASTGLTKAEFETLLAKFSLDYEPFKVEDNPYIPRLILSDKGEALFFILHYLKTHPTYENLGLYFNISSSSACVYVKKLIPILLKSLKTLTCIPLTKITEDKDLQELLDKLPTEMLIDVSDIPIERPENQVVQKKISVENIKNIV